MSTDWYANSRDEQLHMIKAWNKEFAVKGPAWVWAIMENWNSGAAVELL
jgi:hypothetical protein